MAAEVAHLGTADGGPSGMAERPDLGEQSAGQKPSGEAGQREHGEKKHEQGNKADQILNRAARATGEQGLYGVFHRILLACSSIVLIFHLPCKELFKNIREQSSIFWEE